MAANVCCPAPSRRYGGAVEYDIAACHGSLILAMCLA